MEFDLVLDSLMAEGEEGGGETVVEETVDEGGGQGGETTNPDGTPKAGETNQGEQEPKIDGRNNPDAIRKHLAEIKADPAKTEIAKAITDGLGKKRGYEEQFATVREAREVKALLDSVGGREQVTAAIASHATMQRVDALLEAGDPAIAQQLFEQAPGGMAKLLSPILDQAAKANPEAYQAAIAPHAVAMLQKDGMTNALNALVDAFNADNKDGMKDVLGRILQYYKGLMEGTKTKGPDPEREKFEKDKTEWETQKQEEAIKETFNANLQYSGQKIDAGLKDDIKRLGLGPKAVEKLRQDVWHEIETRRKADSVFTSTVNTKFNGKTPKAEAVTFLNGFTDRNLKDAIDEAVTTTYGPRKAIAAKPSPTDPKKKPAAAGERSAAPVVGALKIATPLSQREIDYDDPRTTSKGILNRTAVRKSDKKLVQW